jgi:hypothetical protein
MAGLVTEGLPDQVAASLASFVPGALKVDVVSGAAENTNIAVTGIATEDTVIGAVFFPKEGGAPAKLTVTISAGNIKTATDTTGGKIVVLWADKS